MAGGMRHSQVQWTQWGVSLWLLSILLINVLVLYYANKKNSLQSWTPGLILSGENRCAHFKQYNLYRSFVLQYNRSYYKQLEVCKKEPRLKQTQNKTVGGETWSVVSFCQFHCSRRGDSLLYPGCVSVTFYYSGSDCWRLLTSYRVEHNISGCVGIEPKPGESTPPRGAASSAIILPTAHVNSHIIQIKKNGLAACHW